MSDWQKLLRDRGIASLQQLVDRFGPEHFPDLPRLQQAIDNFELRISPPMLDLIKAPGDPIWRQYVPDLQELEVVDGVADSLDEDRDSPVPNITHRYPDRALFLVSPVCASYCRFCTRRRFTAHEHGAMTMRDLEPAFQYLEKAKEVRDLLLSGGDPLLLSDEKLESLLSRLRAIPHVEFLRIGSRIPTFLPQRITPDLCATLKKFHPLFISIHSNHPHELTAEVREALGRLADAGIPLGNQSVLLNGVNDDAAVMKALVQKLLMCRVKPYYLYQCDLISGSAHLRASVSRGLEIMEQLRGHTTGYAVPTYVIDAPGGGGKVPANPEYVLCRNAGRVLIRNYEGKIFEYPETADGQPCGRPPKEITAPEMV